MLGKHLEEISALKSKMAKSFDMKDMGEASHILGMRIERDRSKKLIWLSQREYIDKVLHFQYGQGQGIECSIAVICET